MARRRPGSSSGSDTPSTHHGGGDGDTPGPTRRRTPGGSAGHVDGGHNEVQAAFAAGRVGNGGSANTGGSTTRDPVHSTVTGEQLEDGYSYDANERLHGPDGAYARDPTAPPGAHNRDSEYPGGYRESTHDEMARRYTLEGDLAGEWPRMPGGQRMPREDMTWFDENGERIEVPPGDRITYDHDPPIVQDWNDHGRHSDRAYRNDAYNNVDNMRPRTGSENSSAGARLGIRYDQETTDGYYP